MSETDESVAGAPPSFDRDERDYLLGRADDHRQRAESAGENQSRMIHVRLQQLYEDRARKVGVVDTNHEPTQEYQERDPSPSV